MNIGLILEGGGMRGIFTAGVLDYFMDQGIVFPRVIGVSAGACHGSSYVCGQRGRAYATATDYLDDPRYCSIQSLRKTGDLFGAEFVYHEIPTRLYPIDNEAFHGRGQRLQVVVTNCITGQAEYPEIHDMFQDMEYVRASSSIPMLSNMVPLDRYVYLDGGVTDSIPLEQSMKQGMRKNVVILTRPRGYRKNPRQILTPLFAARYRRYPKLLQALKDRNRMYNEELDFVEKEEQSGNAFVIAPMGDLGIGRTEKDRDKLKKGYEEGYFVAEGLAEKMKEFMEACDGN